jgi:hypothetical protein
MDESLSMFDKLFVKPEYGSVAYPQDKHARKRRLLDHLFAVE